MSKGTGTSFKPRDIIEADLTEVLSVADHTATLRRCVVTEVTDKSIVFIFGANDNYHHPKKCHCILPGTDDAKPFGTWLRKSTHFSAYNVVEAPLTLVATKVGEIPWDLPDPFDKFFPPIEFAFLSTPALVKQMS